MSTLKIYVMLGFHTSFHHSWRGDTPDEAGFGTDIRVVRGIQRILDEANVQGLQGRGYWDMDVYWTAEQILPRHAPDILDGIRRRVGAGQDEIVLGPYNNGANHAATERELRAALAYARENAFGSGLKQLFGRCTSLLRPQESMYTTGQNAILQQEGISGLVLYYAGVPFNALSTFVPALPLEQRYGTFWLRGLPDEPPLVAWPCISPADLVENVSLEALLLRLRRLQASGAIRSDLLIHINFDADAETWLPFRVPRAFAWFPNTGGLEEYIQVVNRYPWAEFTVPTEYQRGHPPQGEVLVRQDLADGGFDGNYSWAEKYTSLLNWTALEQSRLHTYRAEALARQGSEALAAEIQHRLWEGTDSVFFQRLVGLSTTHYGMSTPVINEERQAKAQRLLDGARDRAAQAERQAAAARHRRWRAAQRPAAGTHCRLQGEAGDDPLYVLEVYAPAHEGQGATRATRTCHRVPLVLPPGVRHVRVVNQDGTCVAASCLNVQPLRQGSTAVELFFSGPAGPGGNQVYTIWPAAAPEPISPPISRLRNRWIDLHLSERTGVEGLSFQGQIVGHSHFLEPFVTYRGGRQARSYRPGAYTWDEFDGEVWEGLCRARLRTAITMDTPHGPADNRLCYTFTLLDDLPYLFLDVEVEYARTPRADTIHTLQQKLRRLLDLRWVEVAPCQLNPSITGPAQHPLRVWKHNYLGVTLSYELDYGRINPRNRNLDSFNHQVTAGWVAVSNGQLGLLLGERAEVSASMAFCPMRLREEAGCQRLSLNPFGSYHGRQPDYRHLGGNGTGADFTVTASGALRPNAPSFNGQRVTFSLLLAPYLGDAPPDEVQAAALANFYPAGVVYLQAPTGLDALLPADIGQQVALDRRRWLEDEEAPLPPPEAFLANPSDGGVDLVWEQPWDPRLSGHEVGWRQAGSSAWQGQTIPAGDRFSITGLANGQPYRFQVRALAGEKSSPWAPECEAVPGPVDAPSLLSAMPGGSWGTLFRLVGHSLFHAIRARLGRTRWVRS
jgi:hypothetical protein